MSAFLLGTGFRANMGTCVRKLVLLKLIDACEDDGTRIFPAIATVARAAQCSERQVQRELRAFLDAGLIRLVREGGKGPGSTNEYAMDLDVLTAISKAGWDAYTSAPAPAAEPQGKGDTVSPLADAEKGDTGEAVRVTAEGSKGDSWSPPTPPVNPSIDPSIERARAREEDRGEDRKSVLRAFERAWQAWPTSIADSRPEAEKAWLSLSTEERELAAAEAERYVEASRATGRKHLVSHAVYLRERRWMNLPAKEAAKPVEDRIVAAPFGPVWGALRMRELLGGPADIGPSPITREKRREAFAGMVEMLGRERAEANYRKMGHGFDAGGDLTFPDDFERRMDLLHQVDRGYPHLRPLDQAAEAAKGLSVKAVYEPLVELMEAVPVNSERYEWWKAEHERRGWPFVPNPGGQRVVYFPKDLGALAQALDTIKRTEEARDDADQSKAVA